MNLPCISVTNMWLLSQHCSIHYLNGQNDKCSANRDICRAKFTECVLTHLYCIGQGQSNTEGSSLFFVPLLDFPSCHSKIKQYLNLKHCLDGWVYSTHDKRHSLEMIQTQTVLMSNKLGENLKLCKSTKTTVSYPDAETCARQYFCM